MRAATMITAPGADFGLIKSQTPCVYVPRRFRIAGMPEIRRGAAIVGTPQGEGTIAIDAVVSASAEPSRAVWNGCAAEAVRRHVAGEEDLPRGNDMRTTFVSEHDLVKIGRHEGGRLITTGAVGEARLRIWIEAGREVHLAEHAA